MQKKLYNEVLVSYDIEESKGRNKLFKELKSIGLIPIQKSVFWGHLLKAEEKAVCRILSRYATKADKAFIARIQLSSQISNKNAIGYNAKDFPEKPFSYYVL